MNLWRVVEHQHKIYEYKVTTTDRRAELLKEMVEKTKPDPYAHQWHELIATPFRYPVPVGAEYAARFKPVGMMKNVFYGAGIEQTCLYEHAYWFFKLRLGMSKGRKTAPALLVSTISAYLGFSRKEMSVG